LGSVRCFIDPPLLTFFCELDQEMVETFFQNDTLMQLLKQIPNLSVSMGIRDLSYERASAVKILNQNNISVIGWILLPKADGYWLNMDNAKNGTPRFLDIMNWTKTYDLEWSSFGLDLEVDMRNEEEFQNDQWIILMESVFSRNMEALELARSELYSLVDLIHSYGYPVQTYIIPFILDERKINSTILQRLIGAVDIHGNLIDMEVPMLYSSAFPDGLGLMESYMNGSDSSHAIGIGVTGGPAVAGSNGIYRNWTEFERDLLFSKNRTRNIFIYSLEGCAENDYLSKISQLDWNRDITSHQMEEYVQQAIEVDDFRVSLEGLLYASIKPWNAIEWVTLNPIETFTYIFDDLRIIMELRGW